MHPLIRSTIATPSALTRVHHHRYRCAYVAVDGIYWLHVGRICMLFRNPGIRSRQRFSWIWRGCGSSQMPRPRMLTRAISANEEGGQKRERVAFNELKGLITRDRLRGCDIGLLNVRVKSISETCKLFFTTVVIRRSQCSQDSRAISRARSLADPAGR